MSEKWRFPDLDIDEHYQRYRALISSFSDGWSTEDRDRVKYLDHGIRQRYTHPTDAEMEWLLENLDDPEKEWFVLPALGAMEMRDDRFLMPLVMAGVNEVNPSLNRRFIQPAVQHFGNRRVMEHLFELVKSGNPYQQSGASNALYWAEKPFVLLAYQIEKGIEETEREAREVYLSVADLGRDISLHLLELFVTTDSVNVQRSIIPRLPLDKPTLYPESHRPLVEQVINIARPHNDDYIRHRVENQLGNESLFPRLPHRNPNTGFQITGRYSGAGLSVRRILLELGRTFIVLFKRPQP